MSSDRQMEIVDGGDVAMVRLLDQTLMDRSNIAEAADGWLAALAQKQCHSLLLDCSGLQRLSSEVLSVLLVLDRRLRRKRAKMALCGVSPAIRATFSVTKIDRLFEIRDARPHRSLA